jgi:hypothetical protein
VALPLYPTGFSSDLPRKREWHLPPYVHICDTGSHGANRRLQCSVFSWSELLGEGWSLSQRDVAKVRSGARRWWLMHVILATQEAKIRRIAI